MSFKAPLNAGEIPEVFARSGRLCSLDGLRAISILLVMAGHLSGTRGIRYFELGIGDYAHLGVVVFFVISGFLITSLPL
jgi:peptidoglycan/LPS O-acetylase OafA/YrhL